MTKMARITATASPAATRSLIDMGR
jgi:hypothetical protein